METGDCVLFETPQTGVFEVRVLYQNAVLVKLLVTQVSPQPGIAGAFISTDPSNAPFTENELKRVEQSIVAIRQLLIAQGELPREQVELLARKLDEIQDASNRLGRRDWINYVTGALTSVLVGAAFSNEARALVLTTFNSAFAWLFQNTVELIR
jgi:hypothetical protein